MSMDDLFGQPQTPQPTPISDEELGRKTAEGVLNSPEISGIGEIAGLVGKGIGAVGGALNRGWGAVARHLPMAQEGQEMVAEAPKSMLEHFAQLEQIPENAVKRGLQHLPGMNPPTEAEKDDPRYANIIKQIPTIPGSFAHGVKETVAEPIGQVMEPLADPLFAISGGIGIFGKTAKGLEAEKAGELASTMGEGAKLGQRALLTARIPGAGVKTIIPSGPILPALSKFYENAKEAPYIGKPLRGLNAETGNTLFDKAKMQNDLATAYANRMKDIGTKLDAGVIDKVSKETGVPADELRRQILDYIEPNSSQSRLENATPEQDLEWFNKSKQEQAKVGESLHPELKSLADRYISEGRGATETPGEVGKYNPREFYIKHETHPQFKGYVSGFTQEAQDAFNEKLKGFMEKRDIPYTINQINDLGKAGLLKEVPELTGSTPELWKYKGPVFDDNVERIANERMFKSAKVNNTHDMMQTVSKIGTPKDVLNKMIENGTAKREDYILVKHPDLPGGEMQFPKPIGRALTDMQNVKPEKINAFFAASKRFMHETAFLPYPGSFTKVFIGNQFLALSKNMWSPSFYTKSLPIEMKNLRKVPLDDTKAIINHPTMGPLTEKKVDELAQRYGGLNMGLYRSTKPEEVSKAFEAGREQYRPTSAPIKAVKAVAGGAYLPLKKAAQFGGSAHNVAENVTRRGVFITALEKGYTAEAAGKMAQDVNFNYSALGKGAKAASQYFPFFTFMYKNLANNARLLYQNPAYMAAPTKAWTERLKQTGTDKEKKMWEDYEIEGQPWPMAVNPKTGLRPWLTPGNIIPSQDINAFAKNPLERVFGSISPFASTPMEEYFNKDTYRNRPIHKIEGERVPTPFGGSLPWQVAYPLQKIVRPYAELGRVSSPYTTPGQKATRLAVGVRFKEHNPEEMRQNIIRQGRGVLYDGRSKANQFFKAERIHRQKGDERQAQADHENYLQAIENTKKRLNELAEKLK